MNSSIPASDNQTQSTPRRALITGGAGFVGSHLAEALLARGEEVTVVDDLSTGSLDNVRHLVRRPGFQLVVDSITNEATMGQLISECDVVFHLAAAIGVQLIVRDPLRVIETNVMGTHAVLRQADVYGRKVLIASTSEVYGKSEKLPFSEDDDSLVGPTTKARWSYACSKALDEFLALAYYNQAQLPVVIFRLFNTVGPRQTGQYGMVLPRFVQQALSGKRLTVYDDGLQSRCFCDVADVVRAIVGLSDNTAAIGQVFNIGSQREITIVDLARRVIELVAQSQGASLRSEEVEDRIRFLSYEQAYSGGFGFEDMRRRIPDIKKISHTIDWHPRISLDATLRRVIAFYQPADVAGDLIAPAA